MRKSSENLTLFKPFFSHVYIEKKAINHPNAKKMLEHFRHAEIIEINHYKDVFSRTKQDYCMQKNSPKLILAVKNDDFVYQGAQVCENFGNVHFYYTSTVMNCIYDCEYCYLQGMYTTANMVVFVNIEDFFREVENLLKKHPVYLCISYDTDILALENVIGYGEKWMEFAAEHGDLKIELRTKSANFRSIEHIGAQENVILAWTLSPDKVVQDYENRTPPLKERLSCIKRAIEKGWAVRLCFDPIIYTEDWKVNYEHLIETIFSVLPGEKIHDVSIGVFRVPKDYLKRMRKQRLNSVILHYPFETVNGVCSYNARLSGNLISYVYEGIKKYVPEDRIYF